MLRKEACKQEKYHYIVENHINISEKRICKQEKLKCNREKEICK